MAKDLGFDGIEIRGLGNQILAVKAQPFTETQLPNTITQLNRLRLEIPCLSSGCCLKYAEKTRENEQEILQYIRLASKLDTPYIRVLGDLNPQPEGEVDDGAVVSALKRLVPAAEEAGVSLLVETNGVYADTARLGRLLNGWKATASARSGICTIPTVSRARPRAKPCRTSAPISNTSTLRTPSWRTARSGTG
jgi:fatty-acyl-CoA synthase